MTEFETACLEAANSFLQTVVLLDDRAAFATMDGGRSDVGDLGAEAPLVDPDDPAAAPVPAPAQAGPQASPVLPRISVQGLDAGLITRGFAAKGLVCAVLRPHPGNTLEKETLNAAGRADIVVLDWEMEDRGEKATEIVRHLHDADVASGGRLRLIAIYTGHSPLTNVYGALKASLTGFDVPEGMKPDRLTLEGPGKTTRIVMLAKSASPGARREEAFVVGEADLPGRLVDEFARFAGGLLPNATLAAIAALRSHTHRMLARLDKSLDGPLITHNILVGDAGDPDDFLASVIMEELESQVPLARIVRRYSGSESIAAYFKHRMEQTKLKPLIRLSTDAGATKDELTLGEVEGLVSSGLAGLKGRTDGIKAGLATPAEKDEHDKALAKSLHKRLYLLTGEDEDRRRLEHERFALITGMRRDRSTLVEADAETHPTLRLGTVLRSGAEFWVCITPVCDCVRIPDAGGSFLLAALSKSTGDWNVIVDVGARHQKLLVDRKRQTIKSVMFGPASAGLVRPVFDGGKPLFKDTANADAAPYEWLGEMKPMQAQRIVQNLTSNLARVGLDEFEWQRRQSPPA